MQAASAKCLHQTVVKMETGHRTALNTRPVIRILPLTLQLAQNDQLVVQAGQAPELQPLLATLFPYR
jgi:hypothetical protein